MSRQLPAPWRAEKIPDGYIVLDATGQVLAYVPSRATEADAIQAKVLTGDEAHVIATSIAQLPQLLEHRQ